MAFYAQWRQYNTKAPIKKQKRKINRWQQQQQELKAELELRKLEIQWKLCFWLLIKARRFAYFCWWTCLLGPRNKLKNTKPVLSLISIDTDLSIAYKITTWYVNADTKKNKVAFYATIWNRMRPRVCVTRISSFYASLWDTHTPKSVHTVSYAHSTCTHNSIILTEIYRCTIHLTWQTLSVIPTHKQLTRANAVK